MHNTNEVDLTLQAFTPACIRECLPASMPSEAVTIKWHVEVAATPTLQTSFKDLLGLLVGLCRILRIYSGYWSAFVGSFHSYWSAMTWLLVGHVVAIGQLPVAIGQPLAMHVNPTVCTSASARTARKHLHSCT